MFERGDQMRSDFASAITLICAGRAAMPWITAVCGFMKNLAGNPTSSVVQTSSFSAGASMPSAMCGR